MKRTILGVLALSLLGAFAAISQTPTAPKHRVVFQLTEPEGAAWEMLIGHVTNMRAAFAKDGSEVEVVFFGPGLNMLLKKNTTVEEKYYLRRALKATGRQRRYLVGLPERNAVSERENGRSVPVREASGFGRCRTGAQTGSGLGLHSLN
jgi:hypothetical protein